MKGNKSSINAVYDEDKRREFILGFHDRKQQRRFEGYKKALIKKKQEAMATKFARRRDLKEREKELEAQSTFKMPGKEIVTSSEDIQSEFTKNAFGEDTVTVTIEYEQDKVEEEELKNSDDELLNASEEEEEDHPEEDTLADIEQKKKENKRESIFDGLTKEEQDQLNAITLSEKEIAHIKQQLSQKKKKGKKGKRTLSKRKRHHK